MRRHKKSLPWRRFGYVILIIIQFGELLLWISLTIIIIINALRSYIKHLKECFIRYPNTSKLVKKNITCLHLFCSTHFSVFGYLMKHSSLCLIYFNVTKNVLLLLLEKKITNNLGGNWQWSMQIILHLFHPW